METKGFVLYLVTGFCLAVLSTFLVGQSQDLLLRLSSLSSPKSTLTHYYSNGSGELGSSKLVWPELSFSWRLALATLIGFLGSAFGTVGGVGGGGIFVPMLNLIVGFDTKSAAALSKCMIMGASASSVWYNLRVPHPSKDVPIIDYDLALLFQPMLMLGITIGVSLSVVFPYWLITVLIIILFLGTSSRSFSRAITMWKEETIMKKELEKQQSASVNSHGELLIDAEYEPLVPKEEKTRLEILRFNLKWKGILALLLVWVTFLALQIFKNNAVVCGVWYWLLNFLQIPVALGVFGCEVIKLYKESKKRKLAGNTETVCEATIDWTAMNLTFCAFCGILGGTVGGLLGSGGGFILGPLLLEIGVIPQVASATATFVMMFSSSLSVVEFYLLKRFPIPFALYLISISVLAGFWGQLIVRKLVAVLKRASIIVFILSAVIFASALTMGIIGVEKSMTMIREHEYMGFLSFCDN
ncbi:hypothetical protein NE237_008948 [Protea cynaroides]|uniref:Sulfite exporter TauE/SafE family protein n=1 Tax=Protea cynaroides TaxID=273540 RepID=A0A9Q0KWM5_9MAGN|nr:hypothetical protein NE237_008948 [Protea cynaroides]